ncbi:nucleotidyl transferase AbiEii/AbiGii toxin family protein [Polaromonas sp. CG_9.11]|uniref:nucleotidyl transferase AbiEii/AbiGii toxin family protein n=1 Tax=Polaromonas sp. CG_9.11 TaxID=2787730 RepID=UPI0018CBCB83|nr:nucleotidyl transferase AbiEii/AbiGii toxin family protein [Polaromonas sp. CG_9.11]MBG6076638.1 putative nucleotidyltransferase component of viral defense system [Polaromonas sp. CG_9.11]
MSLPKNRGASVRVRLLNRAREDGMDYNLILTRYALERVLYRLSVSPWRDAFLLKGALLFDLWFDQPHRPTRDMDLLGFGPSGVDDVAAVFREICVLSSDDGMTFDPATVRAAQIRNQAHYAGVRVSFTGALDGARCAVQIDVGYGDAVTPEPQRMRYPVLLAEMTAPVMRVYPVYTVVAEKYHALASLGMANTRLKDYFDLWFLARHIPFDQAVLHEAIAATFARRGTLLPQSLPLGLSNVFAQDLAKVQQWKAFLRKNKLQAPALEFVMDELRPWLWGLNANDDENPTP